MTNPLRLGTVAHPLALARARAVAGRMGADVVTVEGGAAADAAVDELREALRAGEVDAVVHAYADLPLEPPAGIVLAAVPKRGDARDALCASADLDRLPAGARVGADSPLRRAQLLARRPELQLVEVDGAIDTRLARLAADDPEQRLDAVLASVADLERLERTAEVSERLGLSDWPTAPAQGALAIETRAGEQKRVARLEHRPSRLTADAERAVVAQLATAGALVGASALLEDGLLFLSARVYAPDGSQQLTASHALYPDDERDPAAALADRVARELIADGARALDASGGGSA